MKEDAKRYSEDMSDLEFVRMVHGKTMDILVKHDLEGHLDELLSDEDRSPRFMDAMVDIAQIGLQYGRRKKGED